VASDLVAQHHHENILDLSHGDPVRICYGLHLAFELVGGLEF